MPLTDAKMFRLHADASKATHKPRKVGYHSRASVHGLRSTASTILNEHEFNRDWIEMQPAHSEQDVRSIYNAAEWLSGRRAIVGWWLSYLAHLVAGRKPDGAIHHESANEA